MRRVMTAAATVPLMLMVFLAGVPAAQAQSQICGNNGTGYCLNAWNGGPYVKMYYGGYANDNFTFRPVYACSGHDTVQSTAHGNSTNCPFTNTALDSQLATAEIVEIVDQNNGKCVGTGNLNSRPDVGYLGACGNSAGTGAIDGAFDIVTYDQNNLDPNFCFGQFLVNRYWTNRYASSEFAFVDSGGNPATSLFVGDVPPFGQDPTCWG